MSINEKQIPKDRYEAPAIVREIQAEELSREAHYAGVNPAGSQGAQDTGTAA